MAMLIDSYRDNIDREFAIIETSCNIEVGRALKTFYENFALQSLSSPYTNILYEDGEEKKKSAIGNIISNICGAVSNFVSSFFRMFSNLFNFNGHVTSDDYLNSMTGQIKLSQDIDKIIAEVDREVLEGRKMVQRISSITGISDEAIAKFIDKGAATIKTLGVGAIISATASIGIKKAIEGKLPSWNKTIKDMGSKAEDESDPKKRKQIIDIMLHCKNQIFKAGEASKEFAKEIQKYNKK